MFSIINDFYNYDIGNTDNPYNNNNNNNKKKKAFKLRNKYYTQYQLIYNFTDIIPFNILLGDESISISSIIPIKPFVDDIMTSYISNDSISKQFIMDIDRSRLFINNKRVKSSLSALNYLLYSHKDLAPRLLVCTTQATCATSFIWLHNSLPENYHLGELKYGSQKKSRIYIFNKEICYIKGLRIFKLENGVDHTLKEVLLIITIDDPIYNKGYVTIEFIIVPS